MPRYSLSMPHTHSLCPDTQDMGSCVELCEYMKGSNTPLMVLCSSNNDAKDLYEAGADFVVQQDFLAAKEMCGMLAAELMHSRAEGARFLRMQHSHKEELEDEERDYVMASIGEFI